MSELVPLQIASESNKTKHGQEGAALLSNCYLHINGKDAKVPFSAYGRPGLDLWVTVSGAGHVRQMLATGDGLIAVVGRQIVRVKSDGGVTAVGGLATDGLVYMGENRAGQVGIVSDGQYHVYEKGSVRRVQDPDLPPPIAMTEIAGYFVFPIEDGRVYHTEFDDALSISALDFFTAESKPDGNVTNGNLNNQLVTFGKRTTEFHGLSTDPDNPFSRVTAINIGCWARGSVAEILYSADKQTAGTTLMFAATDAEGAFAGVMMFSGLTPLKISNGYVDRLVGAEADTSNIRSFSWTFEGHSLYCITGTSFSLVYDGAVGSWYDWSSWGKTVWQPVCHAHFSGRNVFGDRTTGLLYQENDATTTENANPIEMALQFPPMTTWNYGFSVDAFHIDATTGVGLTSTDARNSDPVVLLDYSDDGGNHWANPRELKLGKAAQTMKQLVARQLGPVRNARTWRVRCGADVVKGIHQVQAEITRLAA